MAMNASTVNLEGNHKERAISWPSIVWHSDCCVLRAASALLGLQCYTVTLLIDGCTELLPTYERVLHSHGPPKLALNEHRQTIAHRWQTRRFESKAF
jgi:hypothetical protein